MKKAILTKELLEEIKSTLDNADWTYDYCGDEGDADKAINYLYSQKWSLKYLKNYFEKHSDIDFINNLIDEGYDFTSAFVKEAVPRLAELRCSKFTWSGKLGTYGWNLSTACFKINL